MKQILPMEPKIAINIILWGYLSLGIDVSLLQLLDSAYYIVCFFRLVYCIIAYTVVLQYSSRRSRI